MQDYFCFNKTHYTNTVLQKTYSPKFIFIHQLAERFKTYKTNVASSCVLKGKVCHQIRVISEAIKVHCSTTRGQVAAGLVVCVYFVGPMRNIWKAGRRNDMPTSKGAPHLRCLEKCKWLVDRQLIWRQTFTILGHLTDPFIQRVLQQVHMSFLGFIISSLSEQNIKCIHNG